MAGAPARNGRPGSGGARANSGPQRVIASIAELRAFGEKARAHADLALGQVVGILLDPNASNLDKLRAAEVIFQRGFGGVPKAPTDAEAPVGAGPILIQLTGPDGMAATVGPRQPGVGEEDAE